MIQENKELLLKDLCARLPYGVEVYYSETVPISKLKTINSEQGTCIVYDHSQWYRSSKFHIEEIKPYLRPMSSMTDEEKHQWIRVLKDPEYSCSGDDWLIEHHFDIRHLIDKGLAIEVTKENNPYENGL